MQVLKRTGKSGKTALGYAREGATVITDDKNAKIALDEGGWEIADAGSKNAARLTEVPTPTASSTTASKSSKGKATKKSTVKDGDSKKDDD